KADTVSALVRPLFDMRLACKRNRAELPARCDAELDEDLPQVPFDGVCADEQLRRDLLIRQPVAGQSCDLRLLGRQLITGADLLLAHLFTGGDQLAASPFGEGPRTPSGEHVVGGAEVLTGVDAPVHPTQPLAVAQPGASEIHDDAGALQALDGFDVQ